MKYQDFCENMPHERMNRYLCAAKGNKNNAMRLYIYNVKLSASLLSIIAFFEVTLRNRIDKELSSHYGNNWLRDAASQGGIFDNRHCIDTKNLILTSYNKLMHKHIYSHSKLLSELDFGNWRYMFSQSQFNATGRCLLSIFPKKPRSSAFAQYNNTYIFNSLTFINKLRNRIAHHEPICFDCSEIYTQRVRDAYSIMNELLTWMGLTPSSFFYGLDKIVFWCNKIDNLCSDN